MDINDYDELGRTPLMNAAIEGDLVEVRRLLEHGADPDIRDQSFGTTKAANFAGRLARNSEIHRQIHDLLISISSNTSTDIKVEEISSTSTAPVFTNNEQEGAWPYETFRAITGRQITRIRSSIFYLGGIASLLIGIVLVSNGQTGGGFLILFLAPCLLLYPTIRFLFGGKDSVAAAVTTVVVEEYLKNEIQKSAKKNDAKRM